MRKAFIFLTKFSVSKVQLRSSFESPPIEIVRDEIEAEKGDNEDEDNEEEEEEEDEEEG